ncbi:hypothetical protein JHK87_009647 [Glycine soja]|nr:hypothetical protein JHK87_009647 [Glycine soja]
MGAPPKTDVPIMTPNELPKADGLLLGFPTRFGLMAAQFKVFMDATGGLWCTQTLAGKSAGIFYSIGSEGGGQQTTPLTSITQLVHHGMIFVPIGYSGDKVISGSLPNGISSIHNLQEILLQGNQFSGPLSTDIGLWLHLNRLDFSDNQFSGELPKSLGMLSSLSYFKASNNLCILN